MEQALRSRKIKIPNKMYFRIGDVADLLGVKPYVLRYWETEFTVVTPQKSESGQRIYRRTDVEALLLIKHLLYNERYSIEGARKRIRELKRGGEFQAYKREKVLGGEDALQREENLERIKKLVLELRALSKAPVHDFFKY